MFNIPLNTFNPPANPTNDFFSRFSLYRHISGDYLNLDAVFSDETPNFISNNEPDANETIVIKLRTFKNNADSVFINVSAIVNGERLSPTEIRAKKLFSLGIFDFWGAEICVKTEIFYFFRIEKIIGNRIFNYFYNKRGIFRDIDNPYDFHVIPDFRMPNWAKGAVMYQIFVDRFYNGDNTNNIVNNEYLYLGRVAKFIDKWDKDVDMDDICNFYGGDLEGIIQKIQYLRDLGIEAIYLNPVFVSPSNHKYDIQDYDHIDPHYGMIINDGGSPLVFENFSNKYATMYIQRTTDMVNLDASNQLMARLISIAHDNGIRVILDGVFNHCGAFNKWLDKEGFYHRAGYPEGAYRSEKSPYVDFFRWFDTTEWPNNDCYDCWWGHDNHPKLAYENSRKLYDYMMKIAAKWVSPPYNADGWRLDVAADLGMSREFNHRFWRDFRNAVKSANPDAIILAEHYGDPSDWLKGDQWDTVMNYNAFMEPLTWFLTGMEKHSEQFSGDMLRNSMAFENAMRYHMSHFSAQSLHSAMNQLSNHDHSRFLTRTNMTSGRLHTMGARAADTGINKSIMYEAVIVQMTWPGAPTLYYGDEAGLTGWTDPDNRRTYPWGREDKDMLEFHKQIIKIHKSYSCLKTGSLEYLFNDYGVLSYGRWDDENSIAIIINNNNSHKNLLIPLWKINVKLHSSMTVLISTNIDGFELSGGTISVSDGVAKVSLPPFGSVILLEK